MTATRVLVVVEEGASVTLLETHESTDGANHQPNDVVELIAGDRTNVQHVRVNADREFEPVLGALNQAGITVSDWRPIRPTLEDVFIDRLAAEPAPVEPATERAR